MRANAVIEVKKRSQRCSTTSRASVINAIATEAVGELHEVIGVSRAAACLALKLLLLPGPRGRTPTLPRWITTQRFGDHERTGILAVLHSDAHVDHSAYDVFAALLDKGMYVASIRRFYRVLEANSETAARSDQRR